MTARPNDRQHPPPPPSRRRVPARPGPNRRDPNPAATRPDPNRPDPNRPQGRQEGSRFDPAGRQINPRDPLQRLKHTWSPWLVIRYNNDDHGFRPLAANEVFWASPDIWVLSGVPGKAVAGEPNTVVARVVNLGKADGRPTRVDFYWADPSLGLGPAQMNFIGTKWREADAHRATEFVCPTPWVPIMLNGGHECLFANCTSDVLNDKLKHPFRPQLSSTLGS